ncbi:serine/threonine-protein kinase [Urbifossiella limnaea]|uniref:non-specific serine/threonine protein kinase n=1 Tax=Urbifossiella limnaea TaxID=2528023 RepID=A0A517XXL8_9BACT|nr:serine/threonine-protein kinase [Urbifossiella limnaea]QDU22234.1 Serine/threonine-protein kinase PknB [Urbifossiella limnaea]
MSNPDSGVTRTAAHYAGPDSAPGFDPATRPAVVGVAVAALSFGDYDVVAELGEGGMGRVYKAADRNLPRFVAIKVLRTPDEFEASRFRGEAAITARLEHANITRIFEIETTPDGRPYLVLEYAEGGSLDRELRGQPQEPRRAAEMAETLARAIQYAHAQGVIHRDLKPANVLRAKDGTLKLTDFGLAKQYEVSSGLTPSGAVMGTPSYMAPEQAAGTREVGPAADVYGLGAILYELLTGRPPFRGVNMVETLEQVRWADPAPPSRLAPRLPRDLGTICLKCLAKAPARRYASAGELADDLRRWMNGETIAARPAPAWERGWRQFRRRPWETAAVAGGVVVAILLAVGTLYAQRKEAEQEHDRELTEQRNEGERVRREAEQEAARLLRERGLKSRQALDAIKGHLASGALKSTPGLNDLHGVLADYYKQHIDEALADPGPDRAALAGLAFEVGGLAEKSGRLETAEQLYRQARAGFGAAPRAPAKEGDALVKVARVLFERTRDDDARAACDEAEKLWRGLHDGTADGRPRDHADLQLAELDHLRGELCRRRSDAVGACAAFSRAIDIRVKIARKYAAATPEQVRDLPDLAEREWAVRCLREVGRGYGFRGDDHLTLGAVTDADRDYWESHRVREVLALAFEKPRTPAEREEGELAALQFGRSWMNLASVQARHRAYSTARHFATQALKQRDFLKLSGPNNAEYLADFAENHTALGRYLLLQRRGTAADRTAAVEHFTTAATAFGGAGQLTFRTQEVVAGARAERAEALADSDPAAARKDVDAVRQFLADARKRFPELQRLQVLEARMDALDADLAAGPPADPRWSRVLAALGSLFGGERPYRDEHPAEVRQRRCFQGLARDERFEKLFADLRP